MSSTNPFKRILRYECLILKDAYLATREEIEKLLATTAKKLAGLIILLVVAGVAIEYKKEVLALSSALSALLLIFFWNYIAAPSKRNDVAEEQITAFKQTSKLRKANNEQAVKLHEFYERGQEHWDLIVDPNAGDNYYLWINVFLTWKAEVVRFLADIEDSTSFSFRSYGERQEPRPGELNPPDYKEYCLAKRELKDKLEKLRRITGRMKKAAALGVPYLAVDE